LTVEMDSSRLDQRVEELGHAAIRCVLSLELLPKHH
jgi:hypothetical protein